MTALDYTVETDSGFDIGKAGAYRAVYFVEPPALRMGAAMHFQVQMIPAGRLR